MGRTATQAKSEAVKSIRHFKASSEVENFYRYVLENNFRQEAKAMLQAVQEVLIREKEAKKQKEKQSVPPKRIYNRILLVEVLPKRREHGSSK